MWIASFVSFPFPFFVLSFSSNHSLRILRHVESSMPRPSRKCSRSRAHCCSSNFEEDPLMFNMSLRCQTWRYHETTDRFMFQFFESLNLNKRKHVLSIGIRKVQLVFPTNPSIPTRCSFEDIPRVEFEAGDAPSQKAGSYAGSLMHLILQRAGHPYSAGSLEGWCGPVWWAGTAWQKLFPTQPMSRTSFRCGGA